MLCILGSTGFVGRNLKKYLQSQGVPYCTRDRIDGYDWSRWEGQDWIPDDSIVINLACIVGVSRSLSFDGIVSYNETLSLNVAKATSQANGKLVHLSSFVYGGSSDFPLTESSPMNGTNPYMQSKISSERAISHVASVLNIKYLVLRPFNLYGPLQPSSFVVPAIANQLFTSAGPVLLNNLHSTRDYLHIKDLCSAILAVSLKEAPIGEVYNVCSGVETSNIQLYNLMARLLGKDPGVIEEVGTEYSSSRCVGDNSKLVNYTDWSPTFSLSEGIIDTKEFYESANSPHRWG